MLAMILAAVLHSTVGVGYKTFTVTDPVGGAKMDAVAFYPASEATKSTKLGPYTVDAQRNAAMQSGSHPLIVFSHGTRGSSYDDHDIETGLARAGFVVAAVDHAGDNYADSSGLGSDRVLIGRELQMSALIDTVLAEPSLRTGIDATKIGAAGFSAGAYDTLLLGGAQPNFSLKAAYCRAHPDDREFCGWEVRVSEPPLHAKGDPRVRAGLALDPVGLYFDRASLAPVSIPVDLWGARDDTVLLPPWNSQRVNALLPAKHEYHVAPGDHYVFVSPCSASLSARLPFLCVDASGIDRAAIHKEIVENAVDFFSTAL